FVTGVRLTDTVTGEERTVDCKGVFMAIGHTPNTAFLGDALPLKPTGYMVVEAGSTKTGVPGVFGAGDVMDDTYRQAVTAAGTGCMAALEAENWLAENE
ncbi:MAG: FAD-dependent oxidoreductase, partial [Gemmatimonadetes bacterium]|nr:FAD-dependent oxidoreductase [Gemmatimonadota bacterium]